MKISTLTLVSVVAMMLSSYCVWRWAPIPEAQAKPGALVPTAAVGQASVAPLPGPRVGSEFTVGSTLSLEARVGHPKLLAGTGTETYVLALVQAQQVAATSTPVSLAVVIDRSGSMKGRRLGNAVRAASGMIRRLRPGDTVTVVSYDTRATVDVPATVVDDGAKDRIVASLGRLGARGDTCISCGLDRALEQLEGAGGVRHVLLLSDGEATAGVRDLAGFRAIAAQARRRGIAVSSIGVDLDYEERVLSVLAAESNGRHHFVERPDQLASAFDAELSALVQSVAQEAKVVVELADGVRLAEVYDRAHSVDGNRVELPLGAFTAGDRKTALLRVRLSSEVGSVHPVADVRLVYEDLTSAAEVNDGGSLAADVVASPAEASTLDPFVSARLGRYETAQVIEEANRLLRSGDIEAADRAIGTKVAAIAGRSRTATRAAPRSRRSGLEFDFDDQLAALDRAKTKVRKVKKAKARACNCPPGDLMCAMRCSSGDLGPVQVPRAETERAVKGNVEELNPFRE